MKNWDDITGETQTTALEKILQTGPFRLLLAGMYFLLGARLRGVSLTLVGVETTETAEPPLRRRALRRQSLHDARKVRNDYRDRAHLRKFLPRDLTPNQFNERCTRLSHMGRFQIYDWLYYRWEFWRLGAIAQRCRAPQGADGPALVTLSLGLSAAHLGPD